MLLRNYGAIGFKRVNAQFNHAALYPFRNQRLHIRYEAGFIPGPACHVKHYPGLCQCSKCPRASLDYKGTANILRKMYFLSFDYKGLNACAVCIYGACGAGPCPACLSGLSLSSFAISRSRLSVCLLEGRALAPCRVSASAGHGHSIREHRKKCIVF